MESWDAFNFSSSFCDLISRLGCSAPFTQPPLPLSLSPLSSGRISIRRFGSISWCMREKWNLPQFLMYCGFLYKSSGFSLSLFCVWQRIFVHTKCTNKSVSLLHFISNDVWVREKGEAKCWMSMAFKNFGCALQTEWWKYFTLFRFFEIELGSQRFLLLFWCQTKFHCILWYTMLSRCT